MLHRLRQSSLRDGAIGWILTGLLLRALVPAGFMLGAGEGSALAVTLCHGASRYATIARYGEDGRPLDTGSGSHAGQECPFAASALVAPPPAVPGTGPLVVAEAAVAAEPAAPELPPEHARRPGARAPPTNA